MRCIKVYFLVLLSIWSNSLFCFQYISSRPTYVYGKCGRVEPCKICSSWSIATYWLIQCDRVSNESDFFIQLVAEEYNKTETVGVIIDSKNEKSLDRALAKRDVLCTNQPVGTIGS